jgi:hypothetical protein
MRIILTDKKKLSLLHFERNAGSFDHNSLICKLHVRHMNAMGTGKLPTRTMHRKECHMIDSDWRRLLLLDAKVALRPQ